MYSFTPVCPIVRVNGSLLPLDSVVWGTQLTGAEAEAASACFVARHWPGS